MNGFVHNSQIHHDVLFCFKGINAVAIHNLLAGIVYRYTEVNTEVYAFSFNILLNFC